MSIMVALEASIEVEDIVQSIRDDEIYQLIVDLDARVADWDFTIKLCDHFDKLRKEYRREMAMENRKAPPIGEIHIHTFVNDVCDCGEVDD